RTFTQPRCIHRLTVCRGTPSFLASPPGRYSCLPSPALLPCRTPVLSPHCFLSRNTIFPLNPSARRAGRNPSAFSFVAISDELSPSLHNSFKRLTSRAWPPPWL